jgi:two-component system, chemotaxis family, chemotaxis protein CheY
MSYNFERIRILVIDDNQPMLDICKNILLTFGVGEILTAENGRDGFRLFCQENPDIVMADWMMNPTDGIDLTHTIRTSTLSPNHYVPIILMTGFSEKNRVFQARDAGVTEFLVKPFMARDLYKRISQIIERPRQFIKSDEFFGPDRRRKIDPYFTGALKRELDKSKPQKEEDKKEDNLEFEIDFN